MSERFDRYIKDELRLQVGHKLHDYGVRGQDNDYLTDYVLNLLESEKQKLAKAYGGCTLCYGKGYATGAEFWRGRGKTWGRPNKIKYCTCDRGKQLATLTIKQLKEGE